MSTMGKMSCFVAGGKWIFSRPFLFVASFYAEVYPPFHDIGSRNNDLFGKVAMM
jgi:hypothetical protein